MSSFTRMQREARRMYVALTADQLSGVDELDVKVVVIEIFAGAFIEEVKVTSEGRGVDGAQFRGHDREPVEHQGEGEI